MESLFIVLCQVVKVREDSFILALVFFNVFAVATLSLIATHFANALSARRASLAA